MSQEQINQIMNLLLEIQKEQGETSATSKFTQEKIQSIEKRLDEMGNEKKHDKMRRSDIAMWAIVTVLAVIKVASKFF